jgi:hypothetical protein
MTKRPKRGGRVTPKGTPARDRTTRSAEQKPRPEPVAHQRDLPDRVRHGGGFAGRPVSHNRGNR